jgi:hypothetical protein
MKEGTKYFILLAVVIFIAACSHKDNINSAPFITLSETYKQEEVLPIIAQVDFLADTLSSSNYIKTGKSLTYSSSDTAIININDYLEVGAAGPLFRKLGPNVESYRRSPSPFKKSAMLGFSRNSDTTEVNEILRRSGLVGSDIVLRWVPYGMLEGERFSALVAFHPTYKMLELSPKDIKDVKVEQRGWSGFWRMIDSLTGKAEYNVRVSLSGGATERIKSDFSSDSVLLIRCRYKGKEAYFSATAGQVIDGIALDDSAIGDQGSTYKFSFCGL